MYLSILPALLFLSAVDTAPDLIDDSDAYTYLSIASGLLAVSYGFGMYADRKLDKIQGRA